MTGPTDTRPPSGVLPRRPPRGTHCAGTGRPAASRRPERDVQPEHGTRPGGPTHPDRVRPPQPPRPPEPRRPDDRAPRWAVALVAVGAAIALAAGISGGLVHHHAPAIQEALS